ncbi:hypothetical protein ACLMPP_10140 [Yersinia enterocolitica]
MKPFPHFSLLTLKLDGHYRMGNTGAGNGAQSALTGVGYRA